MARPIHALRVADLTAATRFYAEGLGFRLDFTAPEGAAQVSPPQGAPLLLCLPGVSGLDRWMNDTFREVAVGERLYLQLPTDLAEYRTALLTRGITPGPVATFADGGRTLDVPDPDGYIVGFWQPPALSDAELSERYAAGPGLLAAALASLAEEHLDLTRAPGKWTIRQTVHHVADSEASSLVRILMALAEPGRRWQNNPYSPDRWVEGLDHAHRPVAPSVALLRAVREHVTLLVRHLPGALDRTLETSLGGTVTVREMLLMLAGHVAGHAEQIRETRQVHSV